MNGQTTLEKIKTIKAKFEKEWLAISPVQAVGIGLLKNGDTGIIISVDNPDDSHLNIIPPEVDGIIIEINESGIFKAL